MSSAKPVDLVAICDAITVLESSDMPSVSATMRGMANEIERLREALVELLSVVEPSCNTDYDVSHVKRLRALLPVAS